MPKLEQLVCVLHLLKQQLPGRANYTWQTTLHDSPKCVYIVNKSEDRHLLLLTQVSVHSQNKISVRLDFASPQEPISLKTVDKCANNLQMNIRAIRELI